MKRSIRILAATSMLLSASLAGAADRPAFDAYFAAKALPPRVPVAPSGPPAFVASTDGRRGVPSFLWAARQAAPSAPFAAGAGPEAVARLHLARHAARYGLSSDALATAAFAHVHDLGRGGVIVTLRQQIGGIELFRNDVKVLLDRNLELVAIGGNLHAAAVPKPKVAPFSVTEQQATALALSDLHGIAATPADLVDLKQTKAGYRHFDLAVTPAVKAANLHFSTPARAKRVFFPLPDRIVPAYYVELVSGEATSTSSDAYAYVIAADDGRLLYRHDLTYRDSFQYRVWTDATPARRPTDGPMADFNPHPTGFPDNSYPPFVTPSLVTMDGFNKNPNDTSDPWLTAGATQTTGNNVDAYTDDNAPDGFSGGSDIRATVTSPGVFDRTYDPSLGPQSSDEQRMAAITQIFYVTNWLHDWWYDSGFDEASGNAQQSNYGRGGVEGDPMHVEAQDGAPENRNNADMSAMADGTSPRMQMFVWDGTPTAPVDRDGTIDNSVVAHEWGHYLHLRLVTCGSLMCSGESEGWADMNALMMALRPGDDLQGSYAVAQYATASFADPGYFGIRRYPYSVDVTKNALSFRHISAGEPLPNTPGLPSLDNFEPHNAGEVWATMLFEGYVAMLEKSTGTNPPYTFDEARRRMGDYLVAGMKLAPADPTITEQRDAILAAASAADQADFLLLAEAFAKRGAGSCAVSPPRESQDLTGVVESFEVAPSIAVLSVTLDPTGDTCDGDGYLDGTEKGQITVEVMNNGIGSLTATTATVSASLGALSFPNGNEVAFGPIAPFTVAKATIDVTLDATAAKKQKLPFKVTVEDPGACAPSVAISAASWISVDEWYATSTSDDVEAKNTAWTTGGDTPGVWERVEPQPGDHAWLGNDRSGPTDTFLITPPLQVAGGQPFVLSFAHRHQFETSEGVFWDGSVIEVSTDGGANWIDVAAWVWPGYGGTIGDPENQAMNVLKDREGFVDTNPSWPGRDTVTLNFGTAFAGTSVLIRFRVGTDDAIGAYGWEIDDIAAQGISNTPFSALVDDMSPCEKPPIADAGPDREAKGGAIVTLDGSKSSDPNGDSLTFAWKQTAGPPVSLVDAAGATTSFVAPNADSGAKLTFELTVSDGTFSATDTVAVSILSEGSTESGSSSSSGGGQIPLYGRGCTCFMAGDGDAPSRLAAPLAALGALALRRRRKKSRSRR